MNDRDVLIEELLMEQERDNDEPGPPTYREMVHKGDDEFAAPIVAQVMQRAGYVWLYDTKTYERSPFLRYMAPQKLQAKYPDGTPKFTTQRPRDKDGNPLMPWRGQVKCLLHPDQPQRDQYDRMGLAVCTSAHIANDQQLVLHMDHKHPSEWRAIQNLKRVDRETEESEYRRAIINLAAEKATGEKAPLYVSDKKKPGRPKKG